MSLMSGVPVTGEGWRQEVEGGRRHVQTDILRQALQSPEGIRRRPLDGQTELFPDTLRVLQTGPAGRSVCCAAARVV